MQLFSLIYIISRHLPKQNYAKLRKSHVETISFSFHSKGP